MLKRVNKAVFGSLHRFSSLTFRWFGLDNYGWAVLLFLGAAIASLYLYRFAGALAATEADMRVADMRRTSAFAGVVVFAGLAVVILASRKSIRKYATRHYDMGGRISSPLSFFGWFPVLTYLLAQPFMMGPGNLDLFLAGLGVMFALSEPPPMEERMNRSFRNQRWPR
jgi:hypothetical protein